MSENEVMAMRIVKDLIAMPEKKFQECVEHARMMEASDEVKDFLEVLISVATKERKKTIQTA